MESVGIINAGGAQVKLQSDASVKSQKYAANPNLLEKSPQQDEVQLSTQEKKKKRNKILITMGLVATVIGTAVAVIKGKAHKADLLKAIPDDLKTSFAKIKDKHGDEFINEAYSEMVKKLGLENIAPSKIGKTGGDGLMTITGGFCPTENTIGYSDGFFTKLDRTKQLNLISHELKHCKQTTDFLRTEGIGVDEYAKAWADSCVQMKINDPIGGPLLKKALDTDEGKKQLEEFRKQAFDQVKASFEKNYAEVLKMPKISADSEEGKKIHKLFEGCKNYEGLGILGFGGDDYKNNPLEVDAYGFGDKIEKFFTDFIFASK